MRRSYVVLVSLVSIVFVLAYVTTYMNALGSICSDTRYLAKLFLALTYNPDTNSSLKYFAAMSPEAVTAIVWDYRGIDTFYETTVFFMAIIAALTIYRGVTSPASTTQGNGLSLIVKVVTKLLIPMNIAVAVSIAVHGHLTPGGGFQAGAALAVVSVLLAVVFSGSSFDKLNISISKAVALRSTGLLGIAAVTFIPLVYNLVTGVQAYLMQSYVKADAPFAFPTHIWGQLISGTLIWLNVAEFLAVSFGFFVVFMLLSLREETVRKYLGVGDGH
jgi:multicomponent Na+:H+ antiporter subunit B